jgi:hypothetical protein
LGVTAQTVCSASKLKYKETNFSVKILTAQPKSSVVPEMHWILHCSVAAGDVYRDSRKERPLTEI